MGWYQLAKYYELSDDCPAYATALLLHPAMRGKYINTNWDVEWREPAFNAARTIWQEYKDRPVISTHSLIYQDKPLSKFQSLRRALEVTEACNEEDELEKFLNTTPYAIHCSPLDWWTREEQRVEYPRLHHMAIDILSIPPLSDDIERAFSGVRRTTSWERGSLHMDTVEVQECLCNWIANGLIHDNPVVLEQAMAVAKAAETVERDK